jgi:hypothetical protein
MTAPASLKQQNVWLLRAALLIHAAAFAYVAFAPSITGRFIDSFQQFQTALAPGSISLGLIAIARLILLAGC